MPFTPANIKKIARLAKLELTEDDIELYNRQLARLAQHMDRLSASPRETAAPSTQRLPSILRDDVVTCPIESQALMVATAHQDGDFYCVPQTIARGNTQ